VVAIGAVATVRGGMAVSELVKKNADGNNRHEIESDFSDLPLLSKFIICFGRIAEFDPAQPRIAN
jgi:hypothetical protein